MKDMSRAMDSGRPEKTPDLVVIIYYKHINM